MPTKHEVKFSLFSSTGEKIGELNDVREISVEVDNCVDYDDAMENDEVKKWDVRYPPSKTMTVTFPTNEPVDFCKLFECDSNSIPDAYDIQFVKVTQTRKHKKKRINKKWLKKYGYKKMIVKSKGWKTEAYTDGRFEFVKIGR